MASSLMHIIMNYLKISRKPPCFVTVYITADYLYTEVPIHHEPEPLYELLLSKFYFISLTSSPFSFRSTVTSWASFVVIITL